MALSFGKLNFSTSFDRTSAFPLDARSYFESKASADAAAAKAEAAGSSNSNYYFGQIVVVTENNKSKLYIIEQKAPGVITGGVLKEIAPMSIVNTITGKNVTLTKDLIITADVGVHKLAGAPSKTLPTKGKTLEQTLDLLLAKEDNPRIVQPSLSGLNITREVEVGTMFTANYSFTANIGSYQFGPATGVKFTSYKVTDNKGQTVTNTSLSGTLPAFKVEDGFNPTITVVGTHSAGVVPLTNLANPYATGQIQAGTKTISGTTKSFRACFYGALSEKGTITSAQVRKCAGKTSGYTPGTRLTVSIPAGTQRIIVAYPEATRDLISVKDVNGMNAEIASSFKKQIVQVEGANAYKPAAYKVFFLDYAGPVDKANTYTVTI